MRLRHWRVGFVSLDLKRKISADGMIVLPGTAIGSLASPCATRASLDTFGHAVIKDFEGWVCSSVPQWLPDTAS